MVAAFSSVPALFASQAAGKLTAARTVPSRTFRARFSRVTCTIADQRPSKSTSSSPVAPSYSFADQWYALICELDVFDDTPHALTIFDTPVVLYRVGDGKYSVLDDRCSHRLAPLSEGRVVRVGGEARIECAYHGWRFGGCGTCTAIPQLPHGASIPRRSAVRSYPTVAAMGLVWMWLGDPQRADESLLPWPPVLKEKKDVVFDRSWSRYLPFGLEALIENLCDPVHAHWAHHRARKVFSRKLGGSGNQVEITDNDGERITGLWRKFFTIQFVGPASVSYISRANTAVFAVTPVGRNLSRLHMVDMIPTPVPKGWKPNVRWLQHIDSNCTTDGDNPLLASLERKLGVDCEWRKTYVPVPSDGLVLAIRKWYDGRRHLAPWRTTHFEQPMPPKREMIERFHSHTKHCATCSVVLKRLQWGSAALHAAAQTLLTAAVFCALQGVLRTSTVAIPTLLATTFALLMGAALLWRCRRVCEYYVQQLTYTDEAKIRRDSD